MRHALLSARAGWWLIGGASAVLILVGLALFPPHVSVDRTPRYLSSETDSHGFFGMETDDAGNHFVWTEPHASATFTSIGRQPAVLRLVLRSAAVAGGPDAPISIMINGQMMRQLRPDPAILAFQPFEIALPRLTHGEVTVKMDAESFRPGKGDRRTLGTMVQNIAVDQRVAWSRVTDRYWLYGALLPLGALAVAFSLVARRTSVADSPMRGWSARSGYAAVAACVVGLVCMLAAVSILLQIGEIDPHRSAAWLLGSLYLGGFFGAAASRLPWGAPSSPSLSCRLAHARFVVQHHQAVEMVRNAALFGLCTGLALHFLRSPGTGDVQDKLRWMHSMAADGLVRGFQESRDDYPPGTYVILFAFTKVAPHLHMGFLLAYKLSLVFFLTLSSGVLLAWTRSVPLAAGMQTALLMGSMALGYNDVYFIPFLLLALWALHARKLVWFSALFTVACLMKWQPTVLAPAFLIYLFATTPIAERRRGAVIRTACRVVLPAVAILVGALLVFGVEFIHELHRATSENFLSANALNADWIVTHILARWDPQRFDFGPETHRHFIRVPNAAALALLKIPFFVVYGWILARFVKGPKSFATMLSFAYLLYVSYFLFNTSVHENHLVPAVVLGGLLAAYERRYMPVFLVTSIATNVNMLLFYGMDGTPRLPVFVRGIDVSLALATINIVLFVAFAASISRVGSVRSIPERESAELAESSASSSPIRSAGSG